MKKVISVILIVVLCVNLCSCSSKTSNLSIGKFEEAMQVLDEKFHFNVTEVEKGYSLSYKKNEVKFSGLMDEKKNITEITLTANGISDFVISDQDEFMELLNGDYYEMTSNELGSMIFYYYSVFFSAAIFASADSESEESESAETPDLIKIINGEDVYTENGWELKKADLEDYAITARYVG